MPPKVSIVIPSYNGAKYISEAIESVRNQSMQAWELIVVDDGSKDSTADIVKHFCDIDSRIKYIYQENAGVSSARNNGLNCADPEAPYIIFLDQDDIWEPAILEKLTALLEHNPSSVGAHGLTTFIDSIGNKTSAGIWEERCRKRLTSRGGRLAPLGDEEPTEFATMVVLCCIPTPGALLIRRCAMDKVGSFNVSDPQCQDWDLHVRLTRLGTYAFVAEHLIRYRMHAENASHNRKLQRTMDMAVWRSAMSANENTPDQTKVAAEGYLCAQRLYLAEKLRYLLRDIQKGNVIEAFIQAKASAGLLFKIIRRKP